MRKAFTLIELLVMLGMIAVLAALAVLSVFGGSDAAKMRGAVRDVFERAALAGESAVLLTGPQVRPYVRSIIERFRGIVEELGMEFTIEPELWETCEALKTSTPDFAASRGEYFSGRIFVPEDMECMELA